MNTPIWARWYLKSHFAPAFYFLAPHRRRALKSLYAVCRVLDDAVDAPDCHPLSLLEAWKGVFQTKNPALVAPFGHMPLAIEFLEVMKTFDIQEYILLDLIEKGFMVDVRKQSFETPMDLESYCYGVAGTVGLACLPIFGVPHKEAKEYAIRLGICIQWINTIRDVGVDAQLGRIYLPSDHLEQFGVAPRDIMESRNGEAFQKLIAYEAKVARGFYERATELLPPRWEQELLPARVMGKIYLKVLEKVEKQNYPVLTKKVGLSVWEKGLATLTALKE